MSGLVCANVKVDEDELKRQLEQHKVDTLQFGLEDAKTLHEFAQELARGESHLTVDSSGALVRVVDVVLLKICIFILRIGGCNPLCGASSSSVHSALTAACARH